MRDIEFYAQVLGLVDPWFVDDVDLSIENRRVDITVSHHEGRLWPCPECEVELPLYDHAEMRAWRHLDTGGFPTWLHARPPRVKCPTHGVRQVRLPWADPRSRFTTAFERFAIDVMKETDISGAANILKTSWDECWGIMERAVARGRAAKEHQVPALIGVDEKAARKGHSYLTLVYDIERGNVEYIADDRKQASLDPYFESFSAAEREGIRAVVMDMWPAYINSVEAHLDSAHDKIVFDRFHIMKHMGEAVDTVRKREHRDLRAEGIRHAHRIEVSLALRREESAREAQGHLRFPQGAQLEDRTRLGHQGVIGGALALPATRLGHQVLQAVVLLGHPLAPPARHRRRLHDQAAPLRGAQLLLRRPHHQCRCRRAQLEDPDDQEDGLRIPEQGALQDGHLLPLRRPTALPCYPRESRMTQKYRSMDFRH
jgi:transposase